MDRLRPWICLKARLRSFDGRIDENLSVRAGTDDRYQPIRCEVM